MKPPVRLGIIGLGSQVRNHYLPHLQVLSQQQNLHVEVAWISGYRIEDEQFARPYAKQGRRCIPENAWEVALAEDRVDGVLVSLPNALHGPPIRLALELGINVVVDKPTTIHASECRELVNLAAKNDLLFVTASQRRYEDVYRIVKQHIQSGKLGRPLVINYLISHEHYGRGTWAYSKRLAGGGALISSGYHGIDTIFWLLKHSPEPVEIRSVSAQWLLDDTPSVDSDDRLRKYFPKSGKDGSTRENRSRDWSLCSPFFKTFEG